MKIAYVFIVSILLINVVFCQIPRTISYQGVLTDNSGNPKPDGDYKITFSFYETESGGDPIWTETKNLQITKGLFSTLLGDQSPFGLNVKFDKPYFLGIKVGNEAELSPRITLTSTGYSFSSIISDTSKNIIDGKVVKSLNGLRDDVTLEGSGGTTINKSGNKITISSSTGSSGIQEINNTDSTINITNPNGSTTTLNLKVPLLLKSSTASVVVSGNNTGSGTGIAGHGYAYGVYGDNTTNTFYQTSQKAGVYGTSSSGAGVFGVSQKYGLLGKAYGPSGIGVYASGNNWAGIFEGDVNITGTLYKSAGSFRIDHPLDPANKYLSHSFVESPDMMNIYNGNVITDASGNAVINLPDWFEALNKDFRYQLTVIGEFSQAIIESKIQNNQFRIKTDKPNVEVSWMVTGIRKDAYAEQHRIKVEELKPERERGKYLHPELFGQPKEMGIYYKEENEEEIIGRQPIINSSKIENANEPENATRR